MADVAGPSTSAVIASHQAEHRDLLQRLEESDYAQQGLEQARSRVTTLDKSIAEKTKQLESIAAKTKKEYDDWQKYQNSSLRRSLLRVKGKDAVSERVDKEEREYLEAFREVSETSLPYRRVLSRYAPGNGREGCLSDPTERAV